MIEYKVMVTVEGDKYWSVNGELHCEHGPAYEGADGNKSWYLNGEQLTEPEFNIRNSESCSGKVVEIEGVKYKLVKV